MIVTDIIRKRKDGTITKGYGMDGWLAENVAGIYKHQKKDWDVIGIVSGSGKVRVGKSSLAMQIAYFSAWIAAGGEMCFDRDSPDYGEVIKSPTKKVEFDLDHVVFGVDNLMKVAANAPIRSIFVLDEEEGLGAKTQMLNLNRQMERFMQQCGVYNHFVIIVLPDYFSLNKEFATGRSNFLVNTYIGDKYQRGFFTFYSEAKKEKLYVFGRKLLGNQARYSATQPDFYGRFTKFLPFDRDEYELKKRKALQKGQLGQRDARWLSQRDYLMLLLKQHSNLTNQDLADRLGDYTRQKTGVRMIEDALARTRKQIEINTALDEQEKLNHEENLEKNDLLEGDGG